MIFLIVNNKLQLEEKQNIDLFSPRTTDGHYLRHVFSYSTYLAIQHI